MYGFFRLAAAVPDVKVADCRHNSLAIVKSAEKAYEAGAKVVVMPEMCVTAYTCADLFHNATLLTGVDDALRFIVGWTGEHTGMLLFVGAPVMIANTMYNCAIAIMNGSVLAAFPKSYVPNYNEFYEQRWWQSGIDVDAVVDIAGISNVPVGTRQIIDMGNGAKVYAEICEDLWVPLPPSTKAAMAGANVIVNLSASDDLIGKYTYLQSLLSQQSARCVCAYAYASAGSGESSTDLVFDGKAFVYENGALMSDISRWQRKPDMAIVDIDIEACMRDRVHMGSSFATCGKYKEIKAPCSDDRREIPGNLLRSISPRPFVPPSDNDIDRRAEEIINIQCSGLAQRLSATGCNKLIVGISGGLDSTLALLVAARTFDMLALDRKGIIGVTMPGFGTTGRTYTNAMTLMKSLGVTVREIGIANAVRQHFSDIGHDESVHDVTYENSQARERTQILMDIANQAGGMVLGTGDLSELALGWATYNGDHMSMYAVNASVPKTLVKYLVRWFAGADGDSMAGKCLLDIIDTPISPELIPADENGDITQKTEDLVGPYELHDFFLYYTLRYGFSPKKIFYLACMTFDKEFNCNEIKKWIKVFYRRFFNQQFKRSCLPDGPKVGSVCLSPRGDWRMPSDATSSLWLAECDNL